jgi:DNA-binding transcriptional ArsR family regulator
MTTGAHVRHATRATAPPHSDGAHDHEAVARLLHALAEPSRLAIVHLLTGAERRVVDLTRELGLAQSTVSAHLTTLREVGVVAVRREGRSSWYRLVRPEVAHLLADAEDVALAPSPDDQQPA